LKKLGYEESTAVGSGETTLQSIDESDLIEQWWPHKEGGGGGGRGSSSRVEAGTSFVLLTDGISDNLPIETIDRLLRRHPLDRATAALPSYSRNRRADAQRRTGGSTQQLGLDNMSGIVVRFDGRGANARATPLAGFEDGEASLISVLGTHGGPTRAAGGQFGLVCVAGKADGATAAPPFLRSFLESEHIDALDDRLSGAFLRATPRGDRARFAAVAVDTAGGMSSFAAGGVRLPARAKIARRHVLAARETPIHKFIYTPQIWASTLASLGLLLLVSTAFATGTIRPAPPAPPTPRAGEPTPTPDTRPSLSFGGFILQEPTLPTPTPAPSIGATPAPAAPAPVAAATPTPGPSEATSPPPPSPVAEEPAQPCRNFFGIGCPSPPPPPRLVPRQAPLQPAPAPPVPLAVPSPAALPDPELGDMRAANTGPPRGSALESALQAASTAENNFAREVDPRLRTGATERGQP
jgi:hypothetical protein